MRVITRIDGKSAIYDVDTEDEQEAIAVVRESLPESHKEPILACIRGEKITLDEVA